MKKPISSQHHGRSTVNPFQQQIYQTFRFTLKTKVKEPESIVHHKRTT